MAQEIVHSIRNMKRKKKWMMAIKVDLEIYDQLHCDFIWETLLFTGMLYNLIDIIVKCIETTSLSVLWNGNPRFIGVGGLIKDSMGLGSKAL
jgi:hypothetical protein